MAKVSIIAPVYGVEKYITQFLDSIRAITFKDIEVILVDDGSPDNCPQILDEFAKEDERYRVIHQQNAGVSSARNAGLRVASGEYVYVVDSDDWLVPEGIEKLYEAAVATAADLIYGDWIRETDTGETKVRVCFPNEFVTDNPDTIATLQCGVFTTNNNNNLSSPEFKYIYHLGGAPWRYMAKLSIIKDNKLEYDSYVKGLGDDILFSLHLYEYVHKVAYIQKPIYHYRMITMSYSHGYKENYLEAVARTFERMELFLKQYNKSDMIIKFYYYRVLLYLSDGMKRYFKNNNNPKSEKELYKEFKQILKEEPYRTAIKKAPLEVISKKKFRMGFILLRYNLYWLYWLLK